MRIVISSGHGKYIRGASDILDEVDEARRVVGRVAEYLTEAGVDVVEFHDDTSTTQSENLDRIVDFHNSQGEHDLDVSVHFNAYEHTSKPMGVEVLYKTQDELAEIVSEAIAEAGNLIDRVRQFIADAVIARRKAGIQFVQGFPSGRRHNAVLGQPYGALIAFNAGLGRRAEFPIIGQAKRALDAGHLGA